MHAAAPPDWSSIEPYRSFIRCLEGLEEKGFTVQELIEASYVMATAMEAQIYGPRAVEVRTRAIADRYAEEAARDVN